jgi:hypothetical protein
VRRIMGLEMNELREDGAKCITRSFILVFVAVIIRMIKLSVCDRQDA